MKIPDVYITTPHSLLLRWEQGISEQTETDILQAIGLLHTSFSAQLIEMVPSYNELALYLKPTTDVNSMKSQILAKLGHSNPSITRGHKRHVTIPVCYHTSVAPDLEAVASFHKISCTEVIKLHSTPVYRLSFIGFLPGFPYLSGLPKALHTPRKETPRTMIEAGSIGIGARQTGIYPQNSPGGWQIIGKSPLQFFDVTKKKPALLRAGDMITFQVIDLSEFEKITIAVKSESHTLKTEPYD